VNHLIGEGTISKVKTLRISFSRKKPTYEKPKYEPVKYKPKKKHKPKHHSYGGGGG
jgi:hypothetical protein